ncbi:hypothetical protein [Prescottella subtropica]|uniref:hypothetical protein n=1 Tax=Prescottella subtropica TaxID=2545757 RepID=UPI0013874F8D|nr:hypothetical protein [Prescottella subtropica]
MTTPSHPAPAFAALTEAAIAQHWASIPEAEREEMCASARLRMGDYQAPAPTFFRS